MTQFLNSHQQYNLHAIIDEANTTLQNGVIGPRNIATLKRYVAAIEAQQREELPDTLGIHVSEQIQTEDEIK